MMNLRKSEKSKKLCESLAPITITVQKLCTENVYPVLAEKSSHVYPEEAKRTRYRGK